MNDNVVAIVQARMASTRLPGKVLKNISGKPMLWHLINRLRKSKLIDKIIIATTLGKKDESIINFTNKYRVKNFRGSQEDVVDRYYQAAKKHKAQIIVRITSDCPVIDPKIADKAIRYYLDNKVRFDYVNNTLEPTYPRGLDVEVFSFKTLEKAWKEAKKKYQREHVTPYIYENPDKFRLGNVKNRINLSYMRWTVDEKKDLQFVREVYKRLYKKGKIFLMNDIVTLLKKEPELMDINKGVKQKTLKGYRD